MISQLPRPWPAKTANGIMRAAGFAAVFLLAACTEGGGGGDPSVIFGIPGAAQQASAERTYPVEPLDCSVPEMRNWVQANMLDYYLWYDQVPQVNLQNYSSLETLIGDLRVSPFDRFSYIGDAEASNALFEEGKLYGYGWKLRRTSESDVKIAFIYPRSPLGNENVERGDFLLAINGVHPLDMTVDQWDTFLGTGEEIKTPTFTFLDSQGNQRDIAVTRAEFDIDTVLDASVLPVAGTNVGYLAFTQFLETSNTELEAAFAQFNQQNISELVLDLRYNGGGRISVANTLASKIAGPQYAGEVFAEIAYNEKFADNNVPFLLGNSLNSLSLDRVLVLSSANTCSASEMVINGLKPFVDVVQIGGTSCGKPYGSSPRQACGKQMSALEIRFVNAAGFGDYYEGIAADCAASDEVVHALGDPQEAMLKAGLDYISSGSCATVEASASAFSDAAGTRELPLNKPVAGLSTADPVEQEKTILGE